LIADRTERRASYGLIAIVESDTSRGVEGPGPMTLRQPTERHGGNAGIDEEVAMTDLSSDERVALIQSNRTWSQLTEVARAVSVASGSERRIYVERRSDLYRWSLTHAGGGYPLLRITARFLRVDYKRIFVGFRTLPDGTTIICEDPSTIDEAEVWAVLELTSPVSPTEAAELIANELRGPARGG
jgi:hypothetical protein